MYTVGILTASDKGSQGKRIDESGRVIKEYVEQFGYQVKQYVIVADEIDLLEKEMVYMTDEIKVNLLFTTGGTGFSIRDVTPEATKKVITREVPGISEAIRYYSLQITKRAMLSRGISGIRRNTLIINLPGSPKAVKECLEYVLETVSHGLEILLGEASECARN